MTKNMPGNKMAASAEKGNPNLADYSYQGNPQDSFDINGWYAASGVEADVEIRNPGAVRVPDDMTTPLPRAGGALKVGFSIYYTEDDMGLMILDSMKASAEEAGVTLLVNDAKYDQAAQNQAIENWILEEIDGVILAPCDFTGVKTSLDKLEAAGIPVVSLNSPLAGSVDGAVISDTVEQGTSAAKLLVDALQERGSTFEGSIVYQTLPFVHPNALTRAKGFRDVFADYPAIKIVELTGVSEDEHYAAFDTALKEIPDLIGAWGLYSPATIGMMKAIKASSRGEILLSSIDQDKPILKGIYDGEVIGTVAYSCIASARWCMSQMINLLNGAPIPGVVFYANMVINPYNVESAFEHYFPGMTLQEYLDSNH